MSDERPHIILKRAPKPKTRVYTGGGGGTYPRTNYKQHANKIFKQAGQFAQQLADRAANNPADRVYFRVALPKDISAWSTKGQTIVENLHSEVVASPSKNVSHVSARSKSFNLALEELDRYRSSPKQTGKTKFAPIESLGTIPLSEKISEHLAAILDDRKFTGDALKV